MTSLPRPCAASAPPRAAIDPAGDSRPPAPTRVATDYRIEGELVETELRTGARPPPTIEGDTGARPAASNSRTETAANGATPTAAPDGGAPLPAAAADVTLLVCTTCRGPDGEATPPTPGELLLAAVRDAAAHADAIRVAGVVCLANCSRRLSAALVADGGWTYAFGDLTLADAPNLVDGAKMLAAAAGDALPWRGRPDCLKRGLVARIPPLPRGT